MDWQHVVVLAEEPVKTLAQNLTLTDPRRAQQQRAGNQSPSGGARRSADTSNFVLSVNEFLIRESAQNRPGGRFAHQKPALIRCLHVVINSDAVAAARLRLIERPVCGLHDCKRT